MNQANPFVDFDILEVPPYLHSSVLYRNFLEDENGVSDTDSQTTREKGAAECSKRGKSLQFLRYECNENRGFLRIPSCCIKKSTKVESFEDAQELLHTIRFWGLDEIPLELIEYGLKNPEDVSILLDDFFEIEDFCLLQSDSEEYDSRSYCLMLKAIQKDKVYILRHMKYKLNGADTFSPRCDDLFQLMDDLDVANIDTDELLALSLRNDSHCCFLYLAKEFNKNIDEISEDAAMHGAVQCMRMVISNGMPIRITTLEIAAYASETAIVVLLLKEWKQCPDLKSNPSLATAICKCAMHSGNKELLSMIADMKLDCSEAIVGKLTRRGDPELLKFAKQLGFEFGSSATAYAALFGQYDCLEFLHMDGCPWDERTTENASVRNNSSCLEYAIVNGCPINIAVPINAAATGNTECLNIALSHDCPRDEWITWIAAAKGHIDCLSLAIRENCSLKIDICCVAAKAGELICLEHLRLHDCLIDAETVKAAISGNQVHCLRYLHAVAPGIWDETLCAFAAKEDSIDCLRYLHENGCPWSAETTFSALMEGNLECLSYAHQHGCPFDYRCSREFQDVVTEELRGETFLCREICIAYARRCVCPTCPLSAVFHILSAL